MGDHFQRHVVGYATLLGAMLAPIGERLADPAPITHRVLAEMLVGAIVTGCATITAYRAQSGKPPAP